MSFEGAVRNAASTMAVGMCLEAAQDALLEATLAGGRDKISACARKALACAEEAIQIKGGLCEEAAEVVREAHELLKDRLPKAQIWDLWFPEVK